MSTGIASLVIRGMLVDFVTDPWDTDPETSVRCNHRGALVVDDSGRVLWRGGFPELPAAYRGLPCDDHGESLVLPGLIDAHVHFPQYRMLAAPAEDLLDWLNRFTFAEEGRYGTVEHATETAELFLDRLLAHGTTTAVVYSSVHKVATEALFEAARRRGVAMIAGKTMMDRNAPPAVCDDAESGARESAELIETWHRNERLRYAITLRFAVTSTEAQLAAAGELCRQFTHCIVQTHLSESEGEIALVRELFPWSEDYTDVYDRYGLLGPRSLFGHGIHLSERELARLHESGSTIVHCPTSNNFLGSGLFDMRRARDTRRPVDVALASDVGGGTSYSMLQTMAEGYKVARLNGCKLSAQALFHLVTLGNARRLHLDDEIGNFEPGKWADVVVLDPRATPVLAARHELSESLEDILFALMMLGDDRTVSATYIAGKKQKIEGRV